MQDGASKKMVQTRTMERNIYSRTMLIHRRVKTNVSNNAEQYRVPPVVKQFLTNVLEDVSFTQHRLTEEVDYLINMSAGSFLNVLKVTNINHIKWI